MRLTLKAAQVIPVWIAAHRLVFPTNIFVGGHDPSGVCRITAVTYYSFGTSHTHRREIKMHDACQPRSLHSQ